MWEVLHQGLAWALFDDGLVDAAERGELRRTFESLRSAGIEDRRIFHKLVSLLESFPDPSTVQSQASEGAGLGLGDALIRQLLEGGLPAEDLKPILEAFAGERVP